MLQKLKEQKEAVGELRQLADDPSGHPTAQALVDVIVALEYRQLEAVEDLHDALDIDVIDVQKDREARREQLLAVIDAVAPGGNRDLETMWFEEVASEHVENAERAQDYAGLDEDEWHAQIGRWADTWREHLDNADAMSDRELAAVHVEQRFGVDLTEFEREVVEFERGAALETVLEANFEAVEHGIRTAAQEAEDQTQEQTGGADR